MAGVSASYMHGLNKYNNPLYNDAAQGARAGGGVGVGGADGASALADSVAEETFRETMDARRKAGLYAAAKEIRS